MHHRRLSAFMGATALLAAFTLSSSTPAAGYGPKSEYARGFDACAAPFEGTMTTWYLNSTPMYKWIGIYIGGSTRSCSQQYLTKQWVSDNSGTGWNYAPIWVGRQLGVGDGCGSRSYGSYISTNTTTAMQQGETEGQQAVAAAQNLGFSTPSI